MNQLDDRKSVGPGAPIRNADEARNAVLEAVAKVEEARRACDVPRLDLSAVTVRAQEKAYRRFLIIYGAATDRVVTLHRCGLLSDVAYNELRDRVLGTLIPTVVSV